MTNYKLHRKKVPGIIPAPVASGLTSLYPNLFSLLQFKSRQHCAFNFYLVELATANQSDRYKADNQSSTFTTDLDSTNKNWMHSVGEFELK